MSLSNLPALRPMIESLLERARIPGAALAIVEGSEVVYSEGFGYADLAAKRLLTPDTSFPIASTTKAMNGTLLALLAVEGRLGWDVPVQHYLPRFALHARELSPLVTVRDLVVMRTGLAAHDFIWMENPITRAQLVDCLPHLPLALGFRDRFQYNNLTPTVAGHVAEVVTGKSWEQLMSEHLFQPLAMLDTDFAPRPHVATTVCYHETFDRQLRITQCFSAEPIGPAGGTIYSTVDDMGRWLALNLDQGWAGGRQLVPAAALREVHSPFILMGDDPAAPSPGSAYALGWFVDRYNGHHRLSHTGHLHDVHSSVMLFPEIGIGLVSFINFASARLATLINEHAFDRIKGLPSAFSLEAALAQYENKIAANRARLRNQPRIPDTRPSHALADYAGTYIHPGYGILRIRRGDDELVLERNRLVLPLEHWHFDTWKARDTGLFEIHKPNPFDSGSPIVFATNSAGHICALAVKLDPSLPETEFIRESAIF